MCDSALAAPQHLSASGPTCPLMLSLPSTSSLRILYPRRPAQRNGTQHFPSLLGRPRFLGLLPPPFSGSGGSPEAAEPHGQRVAGAVPAGAAAAGLQSRPPATRGEATWGCGTPTNRPRNKAALSSSTVTSAHHFISRPFPLRLCCAFKRALTSLSYGCKAHLWGEGEDIRRCRSQTVFDPYGKQSAIHQKASQAPT